MKKLTILKLVNEDKKNIEEIKKNNKSAKRILDKIYLKKVLNYFRKKKLNIYFKEYFYSNFKLKLF